MTKTSSVGFIGLGYMGHGMARNILANGFPLTVVAHRKREAVEDLVARGAHEVGTVRELAARSDIVLLCVTGPEQVDDLVRREEGLGQRPPLYLRPEQTMTLSIDGLDIQQQCTVAE